MLAGLLLIVSALAIVLAAGGVYAWATRTPLSARLATRGRSCSVCRKPVAAGERYCSDSCSRADADFQAHSF